MNTLLLIWILFAASLAVSFFLSGMEAGVFALSRVRIRQQMRAGRASARALYGYLENSENFLWTILVGNTLANFFILGWITLALHSALVGHRFWFVILLSLSVFLFYALFDLLPKMLFRTYPNRLCAFLARPFGLVHLVLKPLVAIVEWFSDWLLARTGGKEFTGHLFGNREELRLIMQESSQGFTSEERAMINRVLDLQSLSVRQAMKPLDQVVSMGAGAPLAEALSLCRERGLTRLPVVDNRDGRQRVIGLISLNPLLYQTEIDPARPVSEYVKPGLFLDQDMRLEVALRRMQKSGQRQAIVLGRGGQELGIITLQDVLKVIFGEVSL